MEMEKGLYLKRGVGGQSYEYWEKIIVLEVDPMQVVKEVKAT